MRRLSIHLWGGLGLRVLFFPFELVRAWSRLRVVVSSYKMQQQGHEVQAGPRKRPAYRVAGQAWWRSGACEAPRRSPYASCRPPFPLPLTPALCVRTSPTPTPPPALPPLFSPAPFSRASASPFFTQSTTQQLGSPGSYLLSCYVQALFTVFRCRRPDNRLLRVPAAITSLSDNAVSPKLRHILFHPACVRNHIVDRSWAPGYGYGLSTYI
jgi:hypothetical protein